MAAERAASALATDPTGCCTGFYEQDWVRELAQDNFHPGGTPLSRRVVAAMRLDPGAHIVDLGCGTGTTAQMLAGEMRFRVTGIDAGLANVQRARERVPDATFIHADAACVPLADASCDGLLAECAFSLFSNKPGVLAEARRLLRPGGAFGVTDMAVEGRLPEDLVEVATPWTCLGDALDRTGYEALFRQSGFSVLEFGDESSGILELVSALKRKLLLLAASGASGLLPAELPLATFRHWLDRVRDEVKAGRIRYYRYVLRP
jgi:arsenite methyltransferase